MPENRKRQGLVMTASWPNVVNRSSSQVSTATAAKSSAATGTTPLTRPSPITLHESGTP
nr:hypothetical protein [Pseudonocardia sp. TRM90224]